MSKYLAAGIILLWSLTIAAKAQYRFDHWTADDGLPQNSVYAVTQTRDGYLWMATLDGLVRFDGVRFTVFNKSNSPGIGSYDGGLARFKDGKFTRFDTNIGLYNDGVFQILEDERRNFWISSNRGIYRVNRDELNEFADGSRKTIMSIAYGKSDGMLNIECNGGRSPAGVKTRDGRLWFPTQNGVAMIDPECHKNKFTAAAGRH